jgi:glucokinase
VSSPYAIGIDLGATRVKAVVVTPSGDLLADARFDTGDAEAAWRERIKRFVTGIESERGDAKWIGIAAPGLAARDGRTIAWMQGRLAEVHGFDWTAHLARRRIVPVLNDAHAALLGELWQGAAAGAQNAVLLTLGTGVGGAIVCDGRLLRGHLGRAGHLGHLSLDPNGPPDIVNTPGSLEDAIGDHAVHARTGGRFASTSALVAAYLAGDADASRVWLGSVKALAAAVASIINAVDPEIFLIGGGIAQAGPALFDPLNRFLDDYEWRPTGARVRIVPAALGDHAGSLGAARHAMQFDGRKEGE